MKAAYVVRKVQSFVVWNFLLPVYSISYPFRKCKTNVRDFVNFFNFLSASWNRGSFWDFVYGKIQISKESKKGIDIRTFVQYNIGKRTFE